MSQAAHPAPRGCAVVIGAGGGIGRALVERLRGDTAFETIHAFGRAGPHAVDVTVEGSIAAAAATVADAGVPPTLVVVATGLLHAQGMGPDKALSQLDPDWMARTLAVNAIGPALVAKHFCPLLPRDARSVFAALGARVGSIADNRSGGWLSYRASKAALAMAVRTIAIEYARRRPQTAIVAVHPGTVETRLSQPFGRGLPEGQKVSGDLAAERLLALFRTIGPDVSGAHLAYDGSVIPG